MASKYKYESTLQSIIEWANSELEHVGRIVAVHDPNIQYAYAISTVNGMAHLKDALYEMVNDPNYSDKKQDLLRTHDSVIRVMKHLIKDYNIDLKTIRNFNTRDVLSNLSYLENSNTKTSSPLNVKNVPNNYIPNNSKKNTLSLNTNTNIPTNLSNIITPNKNNTTNLSNIITPNKNKTTNLSNIITPNKNKTTNLSNISTLTNTNSNIGSSISTPNNLSLNRSIRNSIKNSLSNNISNNTSTNKSNNTLNIMENNTSNNNMSPPNISLNTSTPQLRSSIVENANSMSQKLRGGKRRRHKSRKHRR